MIREKIEYIKNHKKETAIVCLTGIGMFTIGYFVCKKRNKSDTAFFSNDIGNVARDIMVSHSEVEKANLADIYRAIDEEIFTDIALQIEDYLCDNTRDEKVNIEKWYDVAHNTHKMLKIEMDTVVGD